MLDAPDRPLEDDQESCSSTSQRGGKVATAQKEVKEIEQAQND